MALNLPAAEQLWIDFDYDPLRGRLLRKRQRNGKRPRTELAHECNGYLAFSIGGVHYYEHRLVWAWVTGGAPDAHIDHKDRNRQNNCFWNLRDVPDAANRWTTTKPGYYWREDRQCFAARVSDLEGRKLCFYTTDEEAAKAWVNGKREEMVQLLINKSVSC